MKRYMYLILVAMFSCSAHAQSAVSALPELNPLNAPNIPYPEIQRVNGLPVNIEYSLNWRDVLTGGGYQLNYNGDIYWIKLGFKRGAYDPYIKNYKAVPGIIFSVYIKDNNYTTGHLYTLSEIQAGNVIYAFSGKSAIYAKYSNGILSLSERSGSIIASYRYENLLSAWEQFGKNFTRYYGPNPQYFIPQVYWDNSKGWNYGYVVSEYAPLYPNSKLPLDFVELYRYLNSSYEFKPIAYSIPLGLSFTYLGNQGKEWTWTVKELNEADLADAIADEVE